MIIKLFLIKLKYMILFFKINNHLYNKTQYIIILKHSNKIKYYNLISIFNLII